MIELLCFVSYIVMIVEL